MEFISRKVTSINHFGSDLVILLVLVSGAVTPVVGPFCAGLIALSLGAVAHQKDPHIAHLETIDGDFVLETRKETVMSYHCEMLLAEYERTIYNVTWDNYSLEISKDEYNMLKSVSKGKEYKIKPPASLSTLKSPLLVR